MLSNDNDKANTMNNYFSSVFTIEQLNNVSQLGQYEGNILDNFNFSTEEVQEKLQNLNIYKSKEPDMLHSRILRALEDKLARPLTHMQFTRKEARKNLETTDQLVLLLLSVRL